VKLADHLARQLCRHAERDESLFVLDGDLADSDGAHLFAAQFPDRFLMAGIAEQNLVGVAAGLASVGQKPWAFSFAAFLVYRAYDQIRIGLAQSLQPVVLVGSHAGALAARNGKSHATLNDIALMATLPNVQVYAPADEQDVAWLTAMLSETPRPAYLRLPRADIDALPGLGGTAGPVRVLADPAPTTIVSTGLATHWAAALVRRLAAEERRIGLVHVPQLKPLPDLSGLLEGVETIVTLEDHVTLGGLGSLLQDRFPERPIRKLGWPVSFAGASGSDDELRRAHRLDTEGLVSALRGSAAERQLVC
jgi:transketolase